MFLYKYVLLAAVIEAQRGKIKSTKAAKRRGGLFKNGGKAKYRGQTERRRAEAAARLESATLKPLDSIGVNQRRIQEIEKDITKVENVDNKEKGKQEKIEIEPTPEIVVNVVQETQPEIEPALEVTLKQAFESLNLETLNLEEPLFEDDSEEKSSNLNEPDYSNEYMVNDFIEYPTVTEDEEPEEIEEDEVEYDIEYEQNADVKLSSLEPIESERGVDFGISPRFLDPAAGYGPGEFNGIDNDQRYLVNWPTTTTSTTTTTTTTTTTITNYHNKACVKCHGHGSSTSDTMDMCSANAILEECEMGDVCLIEARRKGGQLIEIRTMCKAEQACWEQQKQNFVGHHWFATQCRPEDGLSRRNGVSVCRQCHKTCGGSPVTFENDREYFNANPGYCFVPEKGIPTATNLLDPPNQIFYNPMDTTCNAGPGGVNCAYGRSWWDADLLRCQKDTQISTTDSWVAAKMCSNLIYPPKYQNYYYYEHHN